jgi:hypothetical protein
MSLAFNMIEPRLLSVQVSEDKITAFLLTAELFVPIAGPGDFLKLQSP